MTNACTVLFLLLGTACSAHSSLDENSIVTAARAGDAAAIRQLAAKGADVNSPAGENEWTPLMHAIHKNQLASVNALLDAHADVNRGGPHGETALMMAAGYGYTDIVQALLRRGANPALTDARGETAIDYAVAGANDIDRFTLFSCQDDTVRALHAAAPQLKAHGLSLKLANIKMCETRPLVR